MFNIKEMIQRNEKLLNGMIPRKSGRDAISVGKVSRDEQTVAETHGGGCCRLVSESVGLLA